ELFDSLQDGHAELGCHLLPSRAVRVVDSGDLRAQLPVHAHVVAPKIAAAHHRYAHPAPGHVPTPSAPGGEPARVSKSSTASSAIPARSAAAISSARSNSSVRRASMPSAVAPERCITSIVGSPTTGTSK